MKFIGNDDVIVMLFRTGSVMKPMSRTFSAFCQWCGDQRTPIQTETPEYQVLMCPVCDQGDE